jgi:hypothetical protein
LRIVGALQIQPAQSYLLIMQDLAQKSCPILSSYWSRAKLYKSEPAEIYLNFDKFLIPHLLARFIAGLQTKKEQIKFWFWKIRVKSLARFVCRATIRPF